MKKKEYQVPSMKVVRIAMTSIICTSLTDVDGDGTGIGYGGGGSGPARAPQRGTWSGHIWDDYNSGHDVEN